ncbi:MAG TPA: hypothetical protein VKT30_19080 [Caulobacteraceae bacterium]|nr:hypothetical protein [Caulobacteraceae bacterium]
MSTDPTVTRAEGAFRAGPWTGATPRGGWPEVLKVFASEDLAAPPMLGAYERDGREIVFTPRFPPAPALRLRAVFQPPIGKPVETWFGGVPQPEQAPTTRVASVTPSGDVWPENILRLYVTFSAPMRIGEAWSHIRMLDAAGLPMGGVFVEIDQELWDTAGQRLTVLFDPARIKRGLVDHIDEGPPLTEGERCTFEIDAYWRDADGGMLVEPFARAVAVGPPLRMPLRPDAWRLTPPARPSEPLVVEVPCPLDAALARRACRISADGAEVACQLEIEAGEQRLVFTPERPWAAGGYVLSIDPVLEDVAGNRIGRPFEIDRGDPACAEMAARAAELRFEVVS